MFLTFDDGPIPEVTPFVLDLLKEYKAKATFFCVGENILKNKAIYERIIHEGHSIGNHTFSHVNGWKSENKKYLEDVDQCQMLVESKLFRPPYGKLKPSQIQSLKKQYSIIMWDVLSKDYDFRISPEKCSQRVLKQVKPGSIIVFHDSKKAESKLRYALPQTLKHFSTLGYNFMNLKSVHS